MSVYRPQGSPYWHYDFQIKGVRFHGSTGAKDKGTAKAVAARKRVEAIDQVHLRKRPSMTLNDAFGRYFEQHASALPSARDIDDRLARLLTGLGSDALLSEIGNAEVADYIAKRRAEVSNASVNREVTILRAVFVKARDEWAIDIGEMPNWRRHALKEPAPRERTLSADEERRLMAALRPDMVPLVRFCVLTGARISSARRLTWADVDYQARTITLREVKSRRAGERHMLPLTQELTMLLANERGRHPIYVFTYERQRGYGGYVRGERYPFSRDGWRKVWRAALRKAKIANFRFHDLRHTAATRILRRTGNLAVVQKILGHADIATTTRYAHVVMDDMRAAMEAVSRKTPEVAVDNTGDASKNLNNSNRIEDDRNAS
ncbi:MAG: site-specific integrase [Alphaproteobacteria bacterium]